MRLNELRNLIPLLEDGTLTKSECHKLADYLRKQVNNQPVAVRYEFDGHGWLYLDNGSGSDWLTRHVESEPLYTSVLED